MSLSITNTLGGGSLEIKNGVERLYFAKDGVSIDKYAFVNSEFAMTSMDNTTESSTTIYSLYNIYSDHKNDEHIVLSNSYSAGDINFIHYIKQNKAFTLQVASLNIWYATCSDSKACSAIKLDSNKFLIYYTNTSNAMACFVLTVGASGISIGSSLLLGITYPVTPSSTSISTNTNVSSCSWEIIDGVIYFFYTSYSGSGTTTCTSSWCSCIRVTISGSTLTKTEYELAKISGSAGYGTNYSAYGYSFCPGLLRLTNGDYAIYVTLTYYGNGSMYRKSSIFKLNISSTGITTGTELIVECSSEVNATYAYVLNNGKIVVQYPSNYSASLATLQYSDGVFSFLKYADTSYVQSAWYYLSENRFIELRNHTILGFFSDSGSKSSAMWTFGISAQGVSYKSSGGTSKCVSWNKYDDSSVFALLSNATTSTHGYYFVISTTGEITLNTVQVASNSVTVAPSYTTREFDDYRLIIQSSSSYNYGYHLLNVRTGALRSFSIPNANAYNQYSSIVGYTKQRTHLIIAETSTITVNDDPRMSLSFYNLSTNKVDKHISYCFSNLLESSTVICTWRGIYYESDEKFTIYSRFWKTNSAGCIASATFESINGIDYLPGYRITESVSGGNAIGLSLTGGSERTPITVVST